MTWHLLPRWELYLLPLARQLAEAIVVVGAPPQAWNVAREATQGVQYDSP